MTQTLTTTPPADDLVVPFHCDRCGALAKVRVDLASGSDLVFCGHHAREYESKLRDIAVHIIDTDGEQRVTPSAGRYRRARDHPLTRRRRRVRRSAPCGRRAG